MLALISLGSEAGLRFSDPSLLYKIIGLQVVVLGFLGAGLALAKTFPPVPYGFDHRWLAGFAACIIFGGSGILIMSIAQ